jgi:hypothetical protein
MRKSGGRPFTESLILWRARQIADPVARLRYLRRAAPWFKAPEIFGRALPPALVFVGLVVGVAYWFEEPAPPVLAAPSLAAETPPPDIWLVEENPEYEVFSNGLRIETAGARNNGPRKALALDAADLSRWLPVREPVGIVYHTTESDLAPFEADRNSQIRWLGRMLLQYVRRKHSYHYLIDRYGTVHRVVSEASPADHAGYSVWADQHRVYLNLNPTFLGVAFETRTVPGDDLTRDAITPAQIRAGRALTEMLRSRHRILAANCITHAQVSVNPLNHRMGNHTDWAANFPFAQMGLPDNYELPAPAMQIFGFTYDSEFVRSTGSRLWRGLLWTDQQMRRDAALAHQSVSEFRSTRKKLYRRLSAALKDMEAKNESTGDR